MPKRSLQTIPCPDFDLAMTLDSGQVFHWEPLGAGYAGLIGDRAVRVEQRGEQLLIRRGDAAEVQRYFALDHPLADICRAFPNDPALSEAANYCRGLRIIRQPIWECLATFITSSMKQVAHIRQMSRALRQRFGRPQTTHGLGLYSFPTAQRLAESSEKELRKCALGYRAKNLRATAQQVSSGAADLISWGDLPDLELHARLSALPGVGAKVANCVMLFAYERLRAFPIDVWIERVLKERYFAGKGKVTPQTLRAFCAGHFGEHGGYAQQYLFHHARKTAPRTRVRSTKS